MGGNRERTGAEERHKERVREGAVEKGRTSREQSFGRLQTARESHTSNADHRTFVLSVEAELALHLPHKSIICPLALDITRFDSHSSPARVPLAFVFTSRSIELHSHSHSARTRTRLTLEIAAPSAAAAQLALHLPTSRSSAHSHSTSLALKPTRVPLALHTMMSSAHITQQRPMRRRTSHSLASEQAPRKKARSRSAYPSKATNANAARGRRRSRSLDKNASGENAVTRGAPFFANASGENAAARGLSHRANASAPRAALAKNAGVGNNNATNWFQNVGKKLRSAFQKQMRGSVDEMEDAMSDLSFEDRLDVYGGGYGTARQDRVSRQVELTVRELLVDARKLALVLELRPKSTAPNTDGAIEDVGHEDAEVDAGHEDGDVPMWSTTQDLVEFACLTEKVGRILETPYYANTKSAKSGSHQGKLAGARKSVLCDLVPNESVCEQFSKIAKLREDLEKLAHTLHSIYTREKMVRFRHDANDGEAAKPEATLDRLIQRSLTQVREAELKDDVAGVESKAADGQSPNEPAAVNKGRSVKPTKRAKRKNGGTKKKNGGVAQDKENRVPRWSSVPRSKLEQRKNTVPRSNFKQKESLAPRSKFAEIENSAPRSKNAAIESSVPRPSFEEFVRRNPTAFGQSPYRRPFGHVNYAEDIKTTNSENASNKRTVRQGARKGGRKISQMY